MRWREITCSLTHDIVSERISICINGVLYYLGDTCDVYNDDTSEKMHDFVIVCFDVRSKKFQVYLPRELLSFD
ncbi:putative F-box associated interaction domain-containing protein [Arabidopsis thaliana]